MMDEKVYELNPVTRITVGAIGRPGSRVFYLQASQGEQTISLKLEKQQVYALAQGADQILEELEQREVRPMSGLEEPSSGDLDIQEPVEPVFVAGQIGLAYDPESSMIVVIVEELSLEEEPSAVARLWASPGQMRALSRHAYEIVASGRPICPLCQRPIDPDGHFCPRSNGHSTEAVEY
jgi:uncharacterized repeat protein (TIGR03847 family)